MKNLPETIGSKRNQSVLHLYLRFFYRVISYSGFFSTKLGMSFYRFFYNSFKDYTEGKKWNYICSLIKDGSTVIDVGSNIGSFTKYILQIQSQGVSCILTDHSLDSLFQISDRNYLIAEGSIVAQGTKSELLKNSTAIKSYFGSSYKDD